jgi:Porin PorA
VLLESGRNIDTCVARALGAVMRKAAIACGVVGVVLLVAAGLMAWWITPTYIARLPSNYDKTRTYAGTISSVINPAALATGNLSAAVKTGLPQTVKNSVKVTATSGNTALVRNNISVTSSGRQIGALTNNYAVDRQSLAATGSHPSSWHVTNARGLTFSWPIPAKQQNYTGWVPYTQSTTPLTYVAQMQHGGINTYEYQSTVPPTRITNPQVLAVLPKSLPVALLPRIEGAGLISPSQLAGLARAFPGAKSIPLAYTYQSTSTYWVAPATGIVVDVHRSERQLGGIVLPGGKIITLLPVLVDSFTGTSSSVSQAATDANNGSSTITTWGVTVPIIAAAVGFVLVVLAIFLWMRGRSRGRPVEVTPGQRHPSPAGQIS